MGTGNDSVWIRIGIISAIVGGIVIGVVVWLVSQDSDRDRLVALYEATDGTNWENDANWLSGSPLHEWYGVTTDDDGRVVGLSLGYNRMKGQVPGEVASLSRLASLSLGGNRLSGEIPPHLGSLASLGHLDLHGNQLSGEAPPHLGSLINLTYLSLHENQLSGEMPPQLANLTNLSHLDLHGNQLSGEIPPHLGSLVNLTHLDLHGNQLSGEIPPHLGSLVNLTHLDLHGNQLSGKLPPELGNLARLTYLNLSGNRFSGEVPDELLRALDELGLLSYRALDTLVFGAPEATVGGVEAIVDFIDFALELVDLGTGACMAPSGPLGVAQGAANLFLMTAPLVVIGLLKPIARRSRSRRIRLYAKRS